MKKTMKWFLVGFILMFYTNISAKALSLSEYRINIDTVEDKTVEVLHSEGEVTFESLDESIFTVTEDGIITPVKDGLALLKVTEKDITEIKVPVFISGFGTIEKRMEEIYNELPSAIKVNFAEEVAKNSDKSYYWNDYLLGESWNLVNNIDDNYMVSDLKIENGKITFDIASNFSIEEDGRYYYADSLKYKEKKEIIVNYKKGNQKNLEIVNNASKRVKKKYKSYINSIFGDLFNEDIENIEKVMIENSNLEKDLNNKDIIYHMDSRRGILLSEYNMFGGYLQLGINGIMYDFSEVEFESVLKMPKIKDKENTLEEIRKYFIENLISSNEDVEIEECGEGIYKAIITEKKGTNILMGKIMNILLPKVNADSQKAVKFSVEEVDNEQIEQAPIINKPIENPKTFDNILIYFYLGIISLFSINILRKLYNK